MSIGLPTHDGERFIAEALESLLRQDHRELEIVVSDNASTDRTPDIVRGFERRDSRVRHARIEAFVSAAQNFNRAFELTEGRTFMWAADDDLWDPSYVRCCAAALEAHPDAVMASAGMRFMDPAGKVLDADYRVYDNPDLSSSSLVERVRIFLRRRGYYQIYGLARRDALRRTRMVQDIYGPDVVLTLELAMLGPILLVPEPLMFLRTFPGRTEADRAARQGGIAGVDDILATRMTHLQESLSAAVMQSALPGSTKVRLRTEIIRAAYLDHTPMRTRTRREAPTRAAVAKREHDLGALTKYTLARTVNLVDDLPATTRRIVQRTKRMAARVKRRVL